MSWWRTSRRLDVQRRRQLYARRRAGARARIGNVDDLRGPAGEPVLSNAPAAVMLRWAWRYRQELAPLYVVIGLATLAGMGHDYAPAFWPLALPLGAAITAAAWRWLTDRRPERAYALAVGGVATLWTAAAWWASPAHGWLVLIALVGALVAGIPRWWHYRRRGKITVQRGAPRGARRELRRIVKNWPELAEYMDLAGSHVQRAEADEIGFTFTLALRAGLTVADVVGKLPRIESVLRTRPGAVRLLPDLDRADRLFVRIVHTDPLATTIPWPDTPATLSEPIALGRFEDGENVSIPLTGGHMLIGGATGRGKSGILNIILADVSARHDVVLWGVDMKRGLELAPWRPVLDRLAVTDDEALDVLTAANRVLDARAWLLAERGERKWKPTPNEPALMVMVDELAELDPPTLALFERLAQLGRAAGIILVAATQRPSAAALGGLDARTQMTTRISLGVLEARDAELILGSGRLGAGWRAERLSGPGYFLALVPGLYEVPRPARAYWLTDEAVRAVAVRTGADRPKLDPVSADAAANPQELPETATTPMAPCAPPRLDDPDEALLAALRAAPRGGLSADELADRIGRSRAWVFGRLPVHEASGRAVKLGRGRWTVRPGGTPVDAP